MQLVCRSGRNLLKSTFFLISCASCGGGEDPNRGAGAAERAAADRARAAADSPAVTPRDTEPWMIDPSRGDSLRPPVDGDTAAEAQPPARGGSPAEGGSSADGAAHAAAPADAGWTAGGSSGGTDQGPFPTLLSVRSGAHPGYDRLVFQFDQRVPSYSIEYVDRPQYQCGSGNPVWVSGDGWLRIRLTPTRAHDEQGDVTVANRSFDPDGENLLEARLICDFEGHVAWIVGMRSPNRYRVLVLQDPPRLVVDVRHE